jgi:hypothetical protein
MLWKRNARNESEEVTFLRVPVPNQCLYCEITTLWLVTVH